MHLIVIITKFTASSDVSLRVTDIAISVMILYWNYYKPIIIIFIIGYNYNFINNT